MGNVLRQFIVTDWKKERVVGQRLPACIWADPARDYCLIPVQTRLRDMQELGLYQFLHSLEGLVVFEQELDESVKVHRPNGVKAWVEVTGLLTDEWLQEVAATLPDPKPQPLHQYILKRLGITTTPL